MGWRFESNLQGLQLLETSCFLIVNELRKLFDVSLDVGVSEGEVMATDKTAAPIIIKRKKIIKSDGHHGGAWKVAYADFVTAMMAFFMLMWLLSATNEKQRKGIADYFSPTTVTVQRSAGGTSSFMGDTIKTTQHLIASGIGQAGIIAPTMETSASKLGAGAGVALSGEELALVNEVEKRFRAQTGDSTLRNEISQHVTIELTERGLEIEFAAQPESPLFDENNTPTPVLERLISKFAEVADLAPNPLAIESHTSARSVVQVKRNAWNVTSNQADAVRQKLIDHGVSSYKFQKLVGYGDQIPKVANVMHAQNSHVKIVFLRGRSNSLEVE